MIRWVVVIVLSLTASGLPAQTVVIESDGGESRVTYDCAAPDVGNLAENGRRAISDYVARMTRAGAVPADSLPALMEAYERRAWHFLERKAVGHACSNGVLPPIERGFPAPGTLAPAFQLRTLDGSRTVALDDQAGKRVIVEFWATWCVPCVRSLQEFNGWAGQSPDGLVVLAINYGEDPDSALLWLERRGFNRVVGLADPDTAVANAYLVRGRIGMNYLLDGQGRVEPACDTCRTRAREYDYGEILAKEMGWR